MEPFKNIYNKNSITEMALELKRHSSNFDQPDFLSFCLKDINKLEMKERVARISNGINQYLPFSYKRNIKTLLKTLKSQKGIGLDGFILWPYTHYIETHGIDDFDTSMHALYEITKRFTSEFGIRPFFEAYPSQTYKLLEDWVQDENEHVRRLVSEGSRPNLPWGINISHLNKNLKKNHCCPV